MNARLTFIHALSPLHAGIGQGSGVIDLPIAREKSTGIPFLPGSSLKGTLHTACLNTSETEKEANTIFGPSDLLKSDSKASMVQFSDQRLLLLPVRSLSGTFAWVTSPYVLERLMRDSADCKGSLPAIAIPEPAPEGCLTTTGEPAITLSTKVAPFTVYLEDLNLPAEGKSEVDSWAEWLGQQVFPENFPHHDYWRTALAKRLCIVHDNVFHFLLQTATEITARIRLEEDSKTVKDGGLWYEEALPTESILSGLVLATPQKHSEITTTRIFEVINILTKKPLQLGGKATVGRGLCRVRLAEGEK